MITINKKLVLTLSLVLYALLLLPAISLAQADQATTSAQQFETGKEYFNNGDYSSALKYFSKAEKLAMKSPALYYNLASTYYKLGDYEQSRNYFTRVRDYKQLSDLADYNIGLISLLKDDASAAEKSFTSVVKNSKDKKLVILAQQKLKSIAAQKKPEWVTKKWSASVSASLGYDDNVNFAPLGITAERGDSFYDIYASADYLFAGDRKNGWSGGVSFYNLNYQTENTYDESEYGAALKKYLQINRDWQTVFSLGAKKLEYNSAAYQTITRLAAESRNWMSASDRLLFRYSYEDISSDNSLYDYLQGSRQKLQAEYGLYNKKSIGRIYYVLELNDRNDLSVTTGDYSYSPTRHLLRGKYTGILSREWRLTGDLSYRASDYPATANQDRQDDRVKAAVYLDYRFNRDFNIRGKVSYTDNQSTEAIYDYKQTRYTVGVNVYF